MKQSVWTNSSKPQAFITQRKQRVKQLNGQVFLNDGDEYEIEIFNPISSFILAKIKIDNDYLSGGGIVLRPGERIFLERFLDSNNKFVFRTYEVGKEAVNLGAIDNNGHVEVEFYYEKQMYGILGGNGWISTSGNGWTKVNHTTNGNPTTFTTTGTNINATYTSTTNAFYNNTSLTSNTLAGPNIRSSKIETGTTEKGDTSKQQFTNSDRTFDFNSFHNVAWRILPTSQKQYHKEELGVLYCGECGAKRKKDTHKFCPHCGTKF